MTAAVLGLAVALVVALAALWWGRRQLTGRLDQLTTSLTDHAFGGSKTTGEAVDRLSHELRRSLEADDARQRRTVARLEAALASTTQGVVIVDELGDIIFQNPFAGAFIEGRHSDAVVADTIDRLLGSAMDAGEAEQEVHLYGPPRRTLLLSATAIGGSGRTENLGLVVLIDDVTEHERLDATRRDFVANVSHELRTPVGAMSLLADALADEDDPTVSADLVDRIQAEAARMGRTIDDLLELSRIEHGTDQDLQPVAIQHIIGEAVSSLESAADQRGVEIGVAVPSQPLWIEGDRRQLRSAVFNLVDNAIKYTEADEGAVSVRARRRGDLIQLEVQDNGIGIPRQDLDRVFERFYRVDKARSRGKGGTGLGLSIVRHVVANQGGRVEIDSTEGEGSTFTVDLPVADEQPATEPTRPDEVNR